LGNGGRRNLGGWTKKTLRRWRKKKLGVRRKNKLGDGERTNCSPLLSRLPRLSLSLPFTHFCHESTSLSLSLSSMTNVEIVQKKNKIQKTLPRQVVREVVK